MSEEMRTFGYLCPKCGKPQTPNLRCDDSFVQDAGWYAAKRRYEAFLHRYGNGRILFLELGVGGNTPGIIKVPFLRTILFLCHMNFSGDKRT